MLNKKSHKEELNLNFVPAIRTTHTGYDIYTQEKKFVLTGARTLNTSFKDWRDNHFTIRTLPLGAILPIPNPGIDPGSPR